MRDLIERQAAIDAMIEDKIQTKIYITATAERDSEVFNGACDRHAKMLKELPSAQSDIARDIATIIENEKDMRVIAQPEIIRCKDCKHYNSYFVECESESGLKHISDHHQWCCNAERRHDEQTD